MSFVHQYEGPRDRAPVRVLLRGIRHVNILPRHIQVDAASSFPLPSEHVLGPKITVKTAIGVHDFQGRRRPQHVTARRANLKDSEARYTKIIEAHSCSSLLVVSPLGSWSSVC